MQRRLGSIRAQGTRSHMPELRVLIPQLKITSMCPQGLKILHTTTDTWHSQIHKYLKFFLKGYFDHGLGQDEEKLKRVGSPYLCFSLKKEGKQTHYQKLETKQLCKGRHLTGPVTSEVGRQSAHGDHWGGARKILWCHFSPFVNLLSLPIIQTQLLSRGQCSPLM